MANPMILLDDFAHFKDLFQLSISTFSFNGFKPNGSPLCHWTWHIGFLFYDNKCFWWEERFGPIHWLQSGGEVFSMDGGTNPV